MGRTLAEKLLGASSGEILIKHPDLVFAHDGTMPLCIPKITKPKFPQRILCFIDHAVPPPNHQIANLHLKLMEFCAEHGIRLHGPGEGICHQLILERYALPGMLIAGADSHTTTHGAVCAFSTGMGSSDIAAIMEYGCNWFQVPDSMKIEITGEFKSNASSKDLALEMISEMGTQRESEVALEFGGEGISKLSLDSRATLANMAAELGAASGLFPSDSILKGYLESMGRSSGFREILPDPDAEYLEEYEFDLSQIEPMLCYPHSVENVAAVSEYQDEEIDLGCIGSCTNGRLEDLRSAARILKGRRVKVPLYIYPASSRVYLEAVNSGIISILVEAGATICAPGCGFCIGASFSPGDDQVMISTQNRNFKGRSGNPRAQIYIASPATVAASAIRGKISVP